jgi:hypothetical protein
MFLHWVFFYILIVREKLTYEIQNRKNSSKNIIWNRSFYFKVPPLPKQNKLNL